MTEWEDFDKQFKDLDRREFLFLAQSLAGYRRALEDEGFSAQESFELVVTFSKFLYDMSIEEFISQKRLEEEREMAKLDAEEDDDVDPFDEDE